MTLQFDRYKELIEVPALYLNKNMPYILIGVLLRIKTFISKDGKKIALRTIERNDLKRIKEFLKYINDILEEDDYLNYDKPFSFNEEREWLGNCLKENRKKESVTIIAEYENRIVGTVHITSKKGRKKHIACLGITIKKEYRNKGIGAELITVAIYESCKRLKSKPKIIELDVFETNKNAQYLYQKLGFKKVAELPHSIERRGVLISKIIMYKYI